MNLLVGRTAAALGRFFSATLSEKLRLLAFRKGRWRRWYSWRVAVARKVLREVEFLGSWGSSVAEEADLVAARFRARLAGATGLFAAALTILVLIPVWEGYGREKKSQAVAVVVFAVLGRLTFTGAVSPLVAAVAYLLPGLFIFSMPRGTAELYRLRAPVSARGLAELSRTGAYISTSGVYFLCLARGVAEPTALAAAFGASALMGLKWLSEAGSVGASRGRAAASCALAGTCAVISLLP